MSNSKKSQRVSLKLGVAAVVKNEAESLLEWIAYHRVIGVENFFIADNDSTDGTGEILEALAEHRLLKCYRFPTPGNGNVQMAAYSMLQRQAIGDCDVVAFIDADEYLLPMDGGTSIIPLIENIFSDSEISALGLNWANFGSGGALFSEDGLIIERFTKHAKLNFGVHHHIKTLVRPEKIESFANPHYIHLTSGRYVHTTGVDIIPHPKHGKGLSSDIVWNEARINHYATKSLEEFLTGKSSRGSATKKARVKHKKYFTSHDKNDEECLLAKQLTSIVLAEHHRLTTLIDARLKNGMDKPSRWKSLARCLLKKH